MGGAIGHTVVCSFVCVCVCEHGPPIVLAEYVSVSILCGIYGRSVSVVVNTWVDNQKLNKNRLQQNTTSAAIRK